MSHSLYGTKCALRADQFQYFQYLMIIHIGKGLIQMKTEQWVKDLYGSNYIHLHRLAAYQLLTGVGTDADAQDVLQDVFVIAVKKDISKHPNPGGWLVSATVKTCQKYIRTDVRRRFREWKYVQKNLSGDSPLPTDFVPDDIENSEIWQTIVNTLKAEELDLLQQYCLDGRPVEEIAGERGMSPNALRVKICRIRKKVKKNLKKRK